jgi:PST family polysaccharide transporter
VKQHEDLFLSESARKGLKEKTVAGASITVIAQAFRIGVGLAVIPLLARLLGPDDFGTFAIVAVLTNFALMFVDAGLSMATVQRSEISSQQVSNLFWISSGLGLIIAFVVAAFGPLLSWVYQDSRLTWLVVACSTSYVFTGLTIQHQALLRRNLQFVRIAFVEIASLIVGQAAAIIWAWSFFAHSLDYWALALVPIVTSFTRMISVWIACSWIPSMYSASQQIGEMLRFGGNLTIGQAFNYVGATADFLAVGYFFGDSVLGTYERSSLLAVQPTRQINGPLASVCVPALSRLIDRPVEYRSAFHTAVSALSCVIMPIAAVCVVNSDLVIALMLGKDWEAAIPIFRLLSMMLLTLPFCNAAAWLLISQGRGGDILKFQVGDSLLKMFLIAVAIPFGVVAVAAACLARSMLMTPLLFQMIGKSGSITASQLWSMLGIQWLAFTAAAVGQGLLRQCEFFGTETLVMSVFVACFTAIIFSTAVMLSFAQIRGGLIDVVHVMLRKKIAHDSATS